MVDKHALEIILQLGTAAALVSTAGVFFSCYDNSIRLYEDVSTKGRKAVEEAVRKELEEMSGRGIAHRYVFDVGKRMVYERFLNTSENN